MLLTVMLVPEGTLREKAPFKSVVVPMSGFPATETAAPITLLPSVSETVPLMDRFWAFSVRQQHSEISTGMKPGYLNSDLNIVVIL